MEEDEVDYLTAIRVRLLQIVVVYRVVVIVTGRNEHGGLCEGV